MSNNELQVRGVNLSSSGANNGGWITFKNGRMLNKVIVGDVMKEANNHDKKIIFK